MKKPAIKTAGFFLFYLFACWEIFLYRAV